MMKAGTYYVGDLCYVMDNNEWDELCSIVIVGEEVTEGEKKMPDGRNFAELKTVIGDGVYFDEEGNEYAVDSGTIGCILLEDIKSKEDIENIKKYNLGQIIEFSESFEVRNEDGILCFGNLRINTAEDL